MEKQMLNHRKSRYLRQAEVELYAWTKMV